MPVLQSVLDLIGNTPLVDVSALSPNPAVRIFAKLEGQNPGGSVKDRIALSMIEDAERRSLLAPGATLIEPSSGNTGIGMAIVSRIKGYRLKVVLPGNVSVERRQLLELWGAEVIGSPAKEGSNGAVRLARQLASDHPEWTFLYQYGNRANPKAHYEGTGPEIWRDCPEITHFVAGLGTTGTLLGVGRFLKEANPKVQLWAVEPPSGETVEGLRNLDDGYIPPIFVELGGADLLDRKTRRRPAGLDRVDETTRGPWDLRGHLLRGRSRGCRQVREDDRDGNDRLHLRRRRMEVPVDGGLDRRSGRGGRAGQDDHLLLIARRPRSATLPR